MRRVLTFVLMLATAGPLQPFAAAAAAQTPAGGSLTGTANGPKSQPIPSVKVQLRNADTGQLASTTTSSATGEFSFTNLPAGNYVVEVLDGAGNIVGTSASIAVAAGATASGVIVTATAASMAAATAAAAAGGSFFTSTIGLVTLAAAGAGVAGVTAAANRNAASPSK